MPKLKDQKLRHNEYYDMQNKFDKLYAQSKEGFIFKSLMEIVRSDENIKLAYRNIKNNNGSHTAGVDYKTVSFIENLDEKENWQVCEEGETLTENDLTYTFYTYKNNAVRPFAE